LSGTETDNSPKPSLLLGFLAFFRAPVDPAHLLDSIWQIDKFDSVILSLLKPQRDGAETQLAVHLMPFCEIMIAGLGHFISELLPKQIRAR
jgi:hypothetical protein